MDDLALERIFKKLDELDQKIDDLCQWKVQMKAEWDSHQKEAEERQNKKMRNRDYMIAMFGVGLGILSGLEILGVV